MKKVAIIQRTLPHYRIPFFEKLSQKCLGLGIEITLFYGQGTKEENMKGDERLWNQGIKLKNIYFKWGQRYLNYQPCFFATRSFDLIITEQATKNILTPLLMLFKKKNQKVALWGHGKNFQNKQLNSRNESTKQKLNHKVDHFFAYNDLSAKVMLEHGVPESSITSVMNSVDTKKLAEELHNVSENDINEFRKRHRLTKGKTAIFCSSMYSEKLIQLLITSSCQITKQINGFKLLLAGAGPDQSIATEASKKYEHIIYLGKLYDTDKSLAYKCSDIMMNPGLVGLNILDSFTAELPLVTTDYPYHSPEIDYLINQENGLLSERSNYAENIESLLKDTDLLEKLKNGCRESAQLYTIENMVDKYSLGIQKCLNK